MHGWPETGFFAKMRVTDPKNRKKPDFLGFEGL